MELKLWCPTCKGRGECDRYDEHDYFDWGKCFKCDGKGYTNPPQQVLDDLECAEIERYIYNSNNVIEVGITKLKINKCTVIIYVKSIGDVKFIAINKLEALRKAKAWLDEKDGE